MAPEIPSVFNVVSGMIDLETRNWSILARIVLGSVVGCKLLLSGRLTELAVLLEFKLVFNLLVSFFFLGGGVGFLEFDF